MPRVPAVKAENAAATSSSGKICWISIRSVPAATCSARSASFWGRRTADVGRPDVASGRRIHVGGIHRRGDATAIPDERGHGREGIPTVDEVDQGIDPVRVPGPNGRDQVAGGVVDRLGRTERPDELRLVARLGGGDHDGTPLRGELDGDRAYAAGGSHDEQDGPWAGLDRVQGVERGRARERDRGGRLER